MDLHEEAAGKDYLDGFDHQPKIPAYLQFLSLFLFQADTQVPVFLAPACFRRFL